MYRQFGNLCRYFIHTYNEVRLKNIAAAIYVYICFVDLSYYTRDIELATIYLT